MKKLNLILNSNRNEIRKFELLLEKSNEEFNLPAEKFINLQIACSEALINAIVHGNKESSQKKVHTEIAFDDNSIFVKINDEGTGFDVDSLPDPTSDENLLKENGRGIYIIRSLVDDFRCSSSENGTEFILTVKKK